MGLEVHLCDGCLHQSKNGIQIYLERVAPLGFSHLSDGGILRGPDAVVGDENIEAAEGTYCRGYKRVTIRRGAEFLLYGYASAWAAAFRSQGLCLRICLQIAESNTGMSLVEKANGRCAYAAGTAGDEGHFVFKIEGDTWHGVTLSQWWRGCRV
jgi:hypothetical protein